MTRVYIKDDPFYKLTEDDKFYDRYYWPCYWISMEGEPRAPWVAVFKKEFILDADTTARIHVSADERFELFLDGERLGRGPERTEGPRPCRATRPRLRRLSGTRSTHAGARA